MIHGVAGVLFDNWSLSIQSQDLKILLELSRMT